jgi:biopolymer transport protein TolR
MVATVSRGRGRRTINEINMVPFIDVMLVLLIIFMVTAPLIAPSVIDLPSIGKATKQPDQVIQITINKNGSLELKNDSANIKQTSIAIDKIANLVKNAQSGKPEIPVIIGADGSVEYKTVIAVMDKLKRANIQRIGLAVQVTNK